MKKFIVLQLLLLSVFFLTNKAHAQFSGLKKWFNKEVIPTVKGKRPLNIDPTRIRVSQNGKDILRASSEGNGSVFIDLGVARIQTNDLRKEIARTAAVLSGNTAVMTQVAFEQFQQMQRNRLKTAVESQGVTISESLPENYQTANDDVPQPNWHNHKVILYNNTNDTLQYAINKKFYKLPPDQAFKHSSIDGQFFLQFDADPSEGTLIDRYFLTANTYSLYRITQEPKIGIERIN